MDMPYAIREPSERAGCSAVASSMIEAREGDGHRLWLLLRVCLLSLRVAALKANQIRALIQLCVRRGARAVLSLATACFE